MTKCPNCHADIDYLLLAQNCLVMWTFTKDREYEEISNSDDSIWICPECDEELFYNEEDAYKFLNGITRKNKKGSDE
jgi:hypothetical protein